VHVELVVVDDRPGDGCSRGDRHLGQARLEPRGAGGTDRAGGDHVEQRAREPAEDVGGRDEARDPDRADVGRGVEERGQAAEAVDQAVAVQVVDLGLSREHLDVRAALVHQRG
jgi:hypothetical protein